MLLLHMLMAKHLFQSRLPVVELGSRVPTDPGLEVDKDKGWKTSSWETNPLIKGKRLTSIRGLVQVPTCPEDCNTPVLAANPFVPMHHTCPVRLPVTSADHLRACTTSLDGVPLTLGALRERGVAQWAWGS